MTYKYLFPINLKEVRGRQRKRLDDYALSLRQPPLRKVIMFEIKAGDSLFRFTFVERLEEIEDRNQDLIICWLEVQGSGMSLQCECEFSLFDIKALRDQLEQFYQSLSQGRFPKKIDYSPRVPTFNCEIVQAKDTDVIGFNFKVCPSMLTLWTMQGGMLIDQSYFPGLIAGLNDILSN